MKIMQLAGDPTDYTWQESLRYFIIGILYIVVGSLPSVLGLLWYNHVYYSDPIDWGALKTVFGVNVIPLVVAYYASHKNLLKLPPWLSLPPDFQPDMKQVEKTTQTTVQLGQPPKTIETVKETSIELKSPADKPQG